MQNDYIPKISVVMPAYNAGRYITEAIQSVIDQSIDDWELIVVDDGSTDNTIEQVERFTDPRITLVKTPGRTGAFAARNTGTSLAKAEWINYLDADDRLKPTAFATLLQYAAKAPDAVVVYGNYSRIDENGQLLGFKESDPLPWRKYSGRFKPSGDVLRAFLATNHMANGGLAIAKKEIVLKAGGWNTSLKCAGDIVLWVHMAALGPFLNTQDCILLEYRTVSTGISRTVGLNFDSYLPSVDAIFNSPIVLAKLKPNEVPKLRRAMEAHIHCYLSRRAIHDGRWVDALKSISKSFLRAPRKIPLNAAKFALSVLGR